MDTFRKWLNKPKADDKSLLARFYHADRALAAVASELDSFDGRSEPDRCSRLVSRLRQSQDKVLFITNLIMDELLGDDRDPRSFRAKFPEEVLQENLGGQLWFGAECLAAGSSIMNREQESKDMRPLAQAVTKSLGNVRNLLRDQCLRHNVPNSRTLHLNLNDSSTEQLCESLKIFDRLFAEFELRYVSAMVQVKTKHEYEMQELICVLFSETLQRALSIGLLEQNKVDSFDPALMFSIPRLAIICGLVIYQRGPLDMDMAADQLSEMFRPFRTILVKIRNLLRSLNKNELHQLERLLCTNEDIHLKVEVGSSSIEAPSSLDQQNNNEGSNSGCTKTSQNSNYDDKRHSFSGDNGGPNKTVKSTLKDNNNPTSSSENAAHQEASSSSSSSSSSHKRVLQSTSNATHEIKTACSVLGAPTCSPVFSVSAESSATSTPTVSPVASPTPSHSIASISSVVSISTTSPTDWTDDDEDNASDADEDVDEDEVLPKEQDIVSADCASGYLIPNTNFGNLLQPQEVPLTDNFVASEDEFAGNQTDAEHTPATLTDLPSTSTVSTQNCTTSTHTYSSEESEQLTIKASTKSERSMASKSDGSSRSTSSCSCSRRQECHQHQQESSSSNSYIASDEVVRRHHHHHAHRHHHHRHHHHHHHHRHQHSKSTRSIVVDEREGEVIKDTNGPTKGGLKKSHTSKHLVSKHSSIEDISSLSDADQHEVSMALRAAGRHKFKSIENLLHRLFVCIAGVADQLQTNFASDLRQILRSVFLMNMSSSEEEALDIPEKTKESELFEFRASENDVIPESTGSNQSIYSAEEVNPELDNVFNNSGSAAVIQRIHTIDLGDNSEATVAANMRNTMGRSRSLGDQHETETGTSGSSSNNNNARNLSSYINGGRLSSPSRQPAMLQRHRNRNNSVGTNSSASSSSSSSSSSPSSSSSSESNSPVSERVSTCFPPTNNCSQSSANSVTANNNNSAVEEGSTGGFLTSTTPSTQSQLLRLAPPAWIPDEKAPRCMSCHTPFTAFRRRHHCRNCGGVFCGVCSNASAPLPKYGLTKAVRMCRECYMREMRSVSSMRNNAPPRAAASMQHPTAAAIVGS